MTSRYDLLFEELKVNKLPTLPHVLTEILDGCLDSSFNFKQISDIISRDSVMAAKVVAVANSPTYLCQNSATSVDRALLVIGTERIKTIAITVSIQQFFSEFNTSQTQYLKSFWSNSLTTALYAKAIATLTSYPHPEHAYLIGLLHNIGELVLKNNFPDELSELRLSGQEIKRWLQFETDTFGMNQAEVGGWLMTRWGQGDFAAAAVKYHRAPVSLVLDAHHLVKVIHLASHLCTDDAGPGSSALDSAERLFGLTPALVEEIQHRIRREVLSVAQSLQIELTSDAEHDSGNESDEHKRIMLAKHIRALSLVRSAQQHLETAMSRQQLHQAIEEVAYLLFGYPAVRILLSDGECLRFWEGGGEESLIQTASGNSQNDRHIDLKVPLENERSLIATAALQNKVLSSSDWRETTGELPVFDQHFLSMMQTTDMVCVPMHSEGTLVGVLVLGSARTPEHSLSLNRVLRLFADAAGSRSLAVIKVAEKVTREMAEEDLQLRLREIAHEANNPLAIVRNYLEILSARLSDQGIDQQELDIIREEIDRAGQILMRLRDLREPEENTTDALDINREIRELVKLFSSSIFISHGIDCDVELDEELSLQHGQRQYLRQVLVNLIKNAVEAMSEGGSLTIYTDHQVNVNGRNYIEIVIKDTGPGLPEGILSNLFEPGKTTKGEGHSGLGLSISRNLVNEMKGSISCRSSRQGTEFEILLPARPVSGGEGDDEQ
ncbi:HDOD domain-containing protein [Hahella ganghwensis]|uniref:HDOD domain-containing protein n=1 Tax=Hahella ganghwensis TaxID=286420 RepID=UPI00036066CB|nr:HDOD domain-containing protein [Hahella ganghwensis]